MSPSESRLDKKIKDIDAKIKALEEKLGSGQISSEEYIPQLLALFYDVEEISPRAKAARKRKIDFKAAILGGIAGWLVFFVTLVLLGPLGFSARGNTFSTTGTGPYQAMLSLLSGSDIQSIQSTAPFFVFVYYLIASASTFPDLFTIVFPIAGGFVAGLITQYTGHKRTDEDMIVGQKKFYYVRLDEGFIAGGIIAAILTTALLIISALAYGQWLLDQSLPLNDSTLPWGYLLRVFLPTFFVYHVAVGGAAGALGEVVRSRRAPK